MVQYNANIAIVDTGPWIFMALCLVKLLVMIM